MVACESHKLDGAGSTPASASMIEAPVQGGGSVRAHSRDLDGYSLECSKRGRDKGESANAGSHEGEWRNGRRSGLKIRRREA